MGATKLLWTPPAGMATPVVAAWRGFYARALDLYAVTPEDYRLLYVAQRGRCWICRKAKGIHPDDPKAGGTRRLGIDHNHVTSVVRGLLCTGGDKTCNRVVGWLDRTQLQRAVDYLDQPPARVLAWAAALKQEASEAGFSLAQWELDSLATAYLWPDDGIVVAFRR